MVMFKCRGRLVMICCAESVPGRVGGVVGLCMKKELCSAEQTRMKKNII